MGAGAAVIAAADRPDLVTRLVLLGPFVRNVPMPPGVGLALRLALLRPWGPRFWRYWHRKLFPSGVPADYDAYQRVAARVAERDRARGVRSSGPRAPRTSPPTTGWTA